MVTFDWAEPGATEVGDAVKVTPGGAPVTPRFNAVLKPPVTDPQLTSVVAELLGSMLNDVTEAARVQPAVTDTVSARLAVLTTDPPAAVTVTE